MNEVLALLLAKDLITFDDLKAFEAVMVGFEPGFQFQHVSPSIGALAAAIKRRLPDSEAESSPSSLFCPGRSLADTIAFDSRDWSLDRKDAWIYGIVCGWSDYDDPEESAMTDVAAKHGRCDATVDVLKQLHCRFNEVFPQLKASEE